MTYGAPEPNLKNRDDKDQLWLICPICKNPNPTGTLHCKYCWGPSLYAVDPISSAELAEFTVKQQRRQKRMALIRKLLVYVGAPLLLVSGIMLWLYSVTDIVFSPPAQMNSSSFPGEAAMFRYDFGRTGSTSLTPAAPSGKLKWSFQAGGAIHSSPVAVENRIYIGSNDRFMYALDAATGDIIWKFEAGSWVESSPAVVNGIIYFGSNDGKLYALDAATGHKLWDFDTTRPVKSSPAVADGMVFFGSFDSYVYSLNAKTGAIIWKYKTGSYILSSPVINQGILYIGSNDNSCYALNASDGRFRIKLSHKEVSSPPSVDGSTAYFTSEKYLVAFDAKARNWPFEKGIRYWWGRFYAARIVPPPPAMTGLLWATKVSFYNTITAPVYEDGSIYTTGDNKIYRVDPQTTKITWTFNTNGVVNASPAIANNIVFAASADGKLYAIGAADGKKIWDYQTGGPISASPTYAKGVVYVATENGVLYAIQ